MWGGVKCWGRCGKVCLSVEGGVGKCVGVWGVRGSVERGVGKCVGVWGVEKYRKSFRKVWEKV